MNERTAYIILLALALLIGIAVKFLPISPQAQSYVYIGIGIFCLLISYASRGYLRRLEAEEEEEDEDLDWPSDDKEPLITDELRQAVEALMLAWARPAVEMEPKPATADLPTAASKIGGCPDIPQDLEWPLGRNPENGKLHPLSFVAQLNLAELASMNTHHELPKTGLLLFFFDMEYAYDGACHVIHAESTEALQRAAFPNELDAEYQYAERALTLSTASIPPAWGNLSKEQQAQIENIYREKTPPERLEEDLAARRHHTAPGGIYHELRAKLRRYEDAYCDSRSYVLGWPDLIQGEMEEECVAKARKVYRLKSKPEDWVLLLQLASFTDEAGEMMFYDMGNLYFWIRRQELAARDFSKVVPLVQCY